MAARGPVCLPCPASTLLKGTEAGARLEPGRLPTCSIPVQVRLQTQTAYQGIMDCVVKTYRHESVGGLLLRGLGWEAS